LAPQLPETAAAQARGDINTEHVTIIRDCIRKASKYLDTPARTEIDHDLSRAATTNNPETLREAAKLLIYLLNQDGDHPNDHHRTQRRGITLGRQDPNGNTPIHGILTPETTAYIQALFAKLAAPGMYNPNDQTPCVNDQPNEHTIHNDDRTLPQRQHDALTTICRNTPSSAELGHHNGLPVTVVVSTTLQDLQAAAGVTVTGSGSLLPISDLIRMASHSHHYLVSYDKHTREPLYLGRTKRLASAAQRLVLYNRDRGCTRPGCTAPANHCQAHHAAQDFGKGGQTNITDLALACGPQQPPRHPPPLDHPHPHPRPHRMDPPHPSSTPAKTASTTTTTPTNSSARRKSGHQKTGTTTTHPQPDVARGWREFGECRDSPRLASGSP